MESCPNCGFDLPPGGRCTVCGYDAKSASRPAPQTRGARAEGDVRRARRAGQAGSRREEAAARGGGASTAVATRPKRQVLPVMLGSATLLVLVAVGLIVAHKRLGLGASAAPKVAMSTTAKPRAQAPASAQPTVSNAAGRQSTGSPAASAPGAKTAARAETRRAAASVKKVRGLKSDSDPLKDKAGKIAAKYERGPQYQIRVGASPVDVRATQPINLFIPPHDPMFNIAGHLAYPPTKNETAFVHWMVTHTPQKNITFLREKWRLAEVAINNGWLTHKRVLMAFLMTPREWFVRAYNLPNSYEQTSLPIGFGQTITDPETVIAMTNALDPTPGQSVLEIGTGSGYQSAFLSDLSNHVFTIEIVRPLGAETNQIYLLHTPQMPQYANIHRRLADGYYGWPKYAPFDRIIVTTGIDHIPPILLQELKPGGIMIIPVGPPTGQTILRVTKTIGPNGQIELKRRDIYRGYAKTIFVPFTAAGGGTHNAGSSSRG